MEQMSGVSNVSEQATGCPIQKSINRKENDFKVTDGWINGPTDRPTRPDTRQYSRGWLGRSSTAKIAWKSEM